MTDNISIDDARNVTKQVATKDLNDVHYIKQIIADKLGKLAIIDAVAGTLVNISNGHHEIHEGDSFNTNVADTAMAADDTLILAFKTSAGEKVLHLLAEFSTLTGGYLTVAEGATWTPSTGTQAAVKNRKREATMNSSIVLEDTGGTFVASNNAIMNPTGATGGNTFSPIYVFGSVNKIGADRRDVAEWILKADTTYVFTFTSTAANNKAQLILNWYEHTATY